jgi:ELWxxDGT repeat protein
MRKSPAASRKTLGRPLSLERLEDRCLLAGTPRLVSDLNATPLSPDDLGFSLDFDDRGERAEVNGTFFFAARMNGTGFELWKSDGTAAGTVLVKDILPGGNSSSPDYLTNVGGALYFTAAPDRLWKSDGSAVGTVLVKDVPAEQLTDVNGVLYFVTGGRNLWKSDGTSEGTVRVKDFPATNFLTGPQGLYNANGTLFFTVADSVNGRELWKSDGTSEGTTLLKDIRPGEASAFDSPQYPLFGDLLFATVGDIVFFAADDGSGRELWRTDGTTEGTVRVKEIRPGSAGSDPLRLTNVAGTLFFTANDGGGGNGLWKSDGTAAGTMFVKNISLGGGVPDEQEIHAINGWAFFRATNGTSFQIWRSDGTNAGTVPVTNLTDVGDEMEVLNGRLYFSGSDARGNELWSTDGTSAGTILVRDLIPGRTSSNPVYLTRAGGRLFFEFDTDDDYEERLGVSDGTAGGTQRFAPDLGTLGSNFSAFAEFDGAVAFSSGIALYVSGGTAACTSRVSGANVAWPPPVGSKLAIGSTLYFVGDASSTGAELWKTDGTAAGTKLVADISPGGASSNIRHLTDVDGVLYFSANDGISGNELWKSDGTSEGTTIVRDIRPGEAGSDPWFLLSVGGVLYFSAGDGVHGVELWRSDGTSEGTWLVADINLGQASSFPADLVHTEAGTFFSADDGVHGRELWKTTGVQNSTILVRDIQPGPVGSLSELSQPQLIAFDRLILFRADDGVTGTELWRSDGTEAGTVLLKDFHFQPGGAPGDLAPMGNRVFFTAYEAATGYELWQTDGTEMGTTLVKDISPGPASSAIDSPTVVGNVLYFTLTNIETEIGREMWYSDGTPDGTGLVADIRPGLASSFPADFIDVGGSLFFTADDGVHGRELWIIPAEGAQPLPGDLSCDRRVTRGDVAILAQMFGRASGPGPGDLDADGRVGVLDLAIIQRDLFAPPVAASAAPGTTTRPKTSGTVLNQVLTDDTIRWRTTVRRYSRTTTSPARQTRDATDWLQATRTLDEGIQSINAAATRQSRWLNNRAP